MVKKTYGFRGMFPIRRADGLITVFSKTEISVVNKDTR